MKINFDSPDLKFFFSFQCPYSYIAWNVISKVLDKTSVTLAPINVGYMPPGNLKYHFRDIWSDERWAKLSGDANKLLLKMSKPEKFVSELSVSRAISNYAADEISEYISSVFSAVFFTGAGISSNSKLRMHLQSESVDSSPFDDAQHDESTLAKAEEQLMIWGHERLRIVPTIDNKGERYAGLIDASGFECYIQDLLY